MVEHQVYCYANKFTHVYEGKQKKEKNFVKSLNNTQQQQQTTHNFIKYNRCELHKFVDFIINIKYRYILYY